MCSDWGESLALAGESLGLCDHIFSFYVGWWRAVKSGKDTQVRHHQGGLVSITMPCARNGGDISVLGDYLEMPSTEVCSVASWDSEAKSLTGTFHQAGQLLSNVGKQAQRWGSEPGGTERWEHDPPGGHRGSSGAENVWCPRTFAVTRTKGKFSESLDVLSVSVNSYFWVISLKAGVTPPKGLWSTRVFWERSLATLK